MWLPRGFEVTQEGRHYVEIGRDNPIYMSEADELYDKGYQVVSMATQSFSPHYIVTLLKVTPCGS